MNSAERILVPLDGSELSQRALPAAYALSRALSRELVLVIVWGGVGLEYEWAVPDDKSRDLRSSALEGLREYVETIRSAALADECPTVTTDVREGDPAGEILAAAGEHQCGLIVMTTHAGRGLSGLLMGSVADRVSRHSPIPVLLVRPEARVKVSEFQPRQIVVPLDGSERAESAMGMAKQLSNAFEAKLLVVRAVPWLHSYFELPGAVVPRNSEELDWEAVTEADAYLRGVTERYGPVETSVVRGRSAQAVTEFVRAAGADLVVMTSHGRGGIARWVLGSVSRHLLVSTGRPVLMVPLAATEEDGT